MSAARDRCHYSSIPIDSQHRAFTMATINIPEHNRRISLRARMFVWKHSYFKHQQNATPQWNASAQFPHCCVSDETSKHLMWQLHTMASCLLSAAINADDMQTSRERLRYDHASIIKRNIRCENGDQMSCDDAQAHTDRVTFISARIAYCTLL